MFEGRSCRFSRINPLPVLLLCSLVILGVTAPALANKPKQEGNLLQNPGFEGNYKAWNGISEIQVASKWTPWWWNNPSHEPAYFRPEYKRASAATFPKRVLSGDSAQQWFTFHASHLAGMYQQVFNVIPGEGYRFSIWAQVWSSTEDDPNTSVLPANPHLQIGIDPSGNWDPGSANIVWSPEASMTSIVDQWAYLSVQTTAQNNIITVFMRTNPDFANKHNDMYWDQASLEAVGPPEPTPRPPTNTPGPPTETPLATNTGFPTNTPTLVPPTETATVTSEPTNTVTITPVDTDTPTMTVTPSITPSTTPVPATNTPTAESTETSAPSPSPLRTQIAAVSPTNVTNEPMENSQGITQAGNTQTLSLLALAGIGAVILLVIAFVVYLLRQAK